MQKQTPMQQLIEWMSIPATRDNSISVITKAKELLKAEENVIKDAYADGLNAHRTNFCNRDEYYNQTFKK